MTFATIAQMALVRHPPEKQTYTLTKPLVIADYLTHQHFSSEALSKKHAGQNIANYLLLMGNYRSLHSKTQFQKIFAKNSLCGKSKGLGKFMLMGLTVSNYRSQGERNSYTAAAASVMGSLESLVMPSKALATSELVTSTAQDNGLDVNASNSANLREYANTLLAHDKMMADFDNFSFSVRQFANAA
jgi:hypothetical protein